MSTISINKGDYVVFPETPEKFIVFNTTPTQLQMVGTSSAEYKILDMGLFVSEYDKGAIEIYLGVEYKSSLVKRYSYTNAKSPFVAIATSIDQVQELPAAEVHGGRIAKLKCKVRGSHKMSIHTHRCACGYSAR